LTGAAFGFEADTFFVDEGNQPNLGQAFLTIDPNALVGRDMYLARVETLITELMKDAGVRLPGVRRRELAARHQVTGITIPEALASELEQLAG
jgi:(2R)-3-sulfolactate dehydrogenase (NADP+)